MKRIKTIQQYVKSTNVKTVQLLLTNRVLQKCIMQATLCRQSLFIMDIQFGQPHPVVAADQSVIFISSSSRNTRLKRSRVHIRTPLQSSPKAALFHAYVKSDVQSYQIRWLRAMCGRVFQEVSCAIIVFIWTSVMQLGGPQAALANRSLTSAWRSG